VWKLDEQTMTATLVFNTDLGNYSPAVGEAQTLSNGNYSFTSGWQGQAPNLFAQTIEVRPDGSKAYVLQLNRTEFRSYRIRTLYEGISDQLAGSGGGETFQHGDDFRGRSRGNQQGRDGPAGASLAAIRDFSDDFGPSITGALSTPAGKPTIPATFPVARSIWPTVPPVVPVGDTAADPAVPDLLPNATRAATDALFADAGNDLWHEGLGDDLARALSS
jgi:hypothetical protein